MNDLTQHSTSVWVEQTSEGIWKGVSVTICVILSDKQEHSVNLVSC